MAADADVGRFLPMAARSIEPQAFSPFKHGWWVAGEASDLLAVQTPSFTPCDILL